MQVAKKNNLRPMIWKFNDAINALIKTKQTKNK